MSISNILKVNGVNQWDLECDTLTITNTINATDTLTGALSVRGGCSIGKDLHVGGTIYGNGGGGSFDPSAVLNLTNTAGSTSTDTGTLTVIGGVGIGENLNVGGTIKCYSVDDATDIETGAVHVDGGMSISKKLYTYRYHNNENAYIGQDLTVIGDINNNGVLYQNNELNSSSTSTGSVILAGGAAIAKDLYVGGTLHGGGITPFDNTAVLNLTNTTGSSSTSTGALTVNGGVGIKNDLYVGGTIHGGGITPFDPTAVINLTNTTGTTSVSTGALTVKGGVAIDNDVNLSGTFNMTNTTNSTSILTGALTVKGGVGIYQNAYIGGDIRIAGDLSISGHIYSDITYNYVPLEFAYVSGIITFHVTNYYCGFLLETVGSKQMVTLALDNFTLMMGTSVVSGNGASIAESGVLSGIIETVFDAIPPVIGLAWGGSGGSGAESAAYIYSYPGVVFPPMYRPSNFRYVFFNGINKGAPAVMKFSIYDDGTWQINMADESPFTGIVVIPNQVITYYL